MTPTTYKKAKQIINDRRNKAQLASDNLLIMLRSNLAFANTEKAIRRLDTAIVCCDDPIQKQQLIDSQQPLKQKLADILSQYNLTVDDLQPKYSCKLCDDTGMVDGKACRCFQSAVKSVVLGNGSINLPNATFANSKEKDAHNVKVYDICNKLCDKLNDSQYRNILLVGMTGTGKTYLAASIANKLLDYGYEVMFVTSYKLNSMFLSNHITDIATRTQFLDNLCDIDVLIIDDLGAENHYNNVSIEYLFDVINERTLNNKSTFISTNLTPESIQDRYGDRLFSRLSDQQITLIMKLIGKDKRIVKL